MLIAIISDIHDNLTNLRNCLDWCRNNKIKTLICCGDITNSETLKFLANNFSGTIHLAQGNIEIYQEQEIKKYKNIKYYGQTGGFKLAGKTIGICHERYLIAKLKKQGNYNMIFYGHSHKPWLEEKDETKLINPGTLGGVFNKASFALWDSYTDGLVLKILERLNYGKEN